MIVPGKYDLEARALYEALGAKGVVMCVIEGNRGNGFSMAARDLEAMRKLPDVLYRSLELMKPGFERDCADIEKLAASGGEKKP